MGIELTAALDSFDDDAALDDTDNIILGDGKKTTVATLAADSAFTSQFVPTYVADAATYGDDSTDATSYLQGLLTVAALSDGRATVHLPAGTYIASNLTIDSLVTLTGEGQGSIVKQKASSTGPLLALDNDQVQGVNVLRLRINGNKANQSAANEGLSFVNAIAPISPSLFTVGDAHHVIGEVMVESCKGDGVRITGRGASRINDVWSLLNDGDGFWVDGFDSNYTNCDAGANGGYGWNLSEPPTYASNDSLYACKAFSNTLSGFAIGNGSGVRLMDCIAQGNRQHGFLLINGRDNILSDCNAQDNSYGATGVYQGFAITGTGLRHRITGSAYNLAYSTQTAAVAIESTVNNCVIDVSTDSQHLTSASVLGNNRATFTGRCAPVTALWLPGTASVNVSTPDAAAFDLTGDLCIVLDVTLPDYSPAAASVLFAKSSTASNFSYDIQLTTSGTLQFRWSTDGTTGAGLASATSTVSMNTAGISDATRTQLAVTFDADNGASGSSTRFWKRANSDSEWVQIGATVTGGSTVTIFSGTSPLELGSRAASSPTLGLFHSLSLRSGTGAAGIVGGTEVASFRSDANVGPRYRDALGNIWTINGSTWAWQVA